MGRSAAAPARPAAPRRRSAWQGLSRSGRRPPPSASSDCHNVGVACITVAPLASIVLRQRLRDPARSRARAIDDRGAADERQIKLQRRDVEADGGDGEQPVVRRRAAPARAIEPRKLLKRAVAHHHALRRAGRARGVDHIGRMARIEGRARRGGAAGARSPLSRRRAARLRRGARPHRCGSRSSSADCVTSTAAPASGQHEGQPLGADSPDRAAGRRRRP